MSSKKSQIQKFREKARELGAEEGEAQFNASLQAIAAHKPPREDGAPKAAKAKRSEKKRGR